jgi:hypothetical protein
MDEGKNSGPRNLGALFGAAAARAGHGTTPAGEAYICGRLGVRRLPPDLAQEPVPGTEAEARAVGVRHDVPGLLLWLLVSEERPAGPSLQPRCSGGFANRVLALEPSLRRVLELVAEGYDDTAIASAVGLDAALVGSRVAGLCLWFETPPGRHPRVWLAVRYQRLTYHPP